MHAFDYLTLMPRRPMTNPPAVRTGGVFQASVKGLQSPQAPYQTRRALMV